jgi:hypothetical protein
MKGKSFGKGHGGHKGKHGGERSLLEKWREEVNQLGASNMDKKEKKVLPSILPMYYYPRGATCEQIATHLILFFSLSYLVPSQNFVTTKLIALGAKPAKGAHIPLPIFKVYIHIFPLLLFLNEPCSWTQISTFSSISCPSFLFRPHRVF